MEHIDGNLVIIIIGILAIVAMALGQLDKLTAFVKALFRKR
jgi:hypothetical protein